jgi:hypothetical protein
MNHLFGIALLAPMILSLLVAASGTATSFNSLAPGETEVAFFNGSVNDNQYEGVLPATGDYRIRVYMVHSAARRNEKAVYRLETTITGRPQAAAGDTPAAISSQHDDAAGADISQGDSGAAFSVRRAGDLNMIEVGDERHEIPDAAVHGG